jgi:hypothetical protein
MKRTLIAAVLLFVVPGVIEAQNAPLATALKAWVAGALPQCPDGVLTMDAVEGGPSGFNTFVVALKSSDQFCGTQKYLLYSPASRQVLLGSVLPLPDDTRALAARVSAKASELLNKEMTATIAPAVLPDGLKAVSMSRTTPYGPFAYRGYVDASGRFLVVGMRSHLNTSPSAALSQLLVATTSMVRRGNPKAAVEIIEISEFQCPTCANAHEMLEPIIEANLSRINYARIDLPLFEHHEWALPSAIAARAVHRIAPLRYWDFVDETFKQQEAIGKVRFDQYFEEFASKYKLDWPALRKIYSTDSERQAMLDQVSALFSWGIAATPTYIVNGKIMGFGPNGSFTIAEIKRALAAAAR